MLKTTAINMSTININAAIKYHINMCLIVLLLSHVAIVRAAAAAADEKVDTSIIPTNPDWGVECNTIDIRNECSSFLQLQNCTVIRGILLILLLPRARKGIQQTCEYEKYRFVLLREITDYFILFNVKGLKSIRNMFPNLTVIRGRRLFMNYALSITKMPDLKAIEFQSLIAIQRGHVYIDNSPKLCNLEKINWDRLTLTAGKNHIYPMEVENCIPSECRGCASDYCWSNMECQKFENDNLANRMQDNHNCHATCLGGCYNNTREGCVVCRGLTDHGVCTDACDKDKYLLQHYQRCYTREECVHDLGFYIYKNTCVKDCPNHYVANKTSNECVLCTTTNQTNCLRVCDGYGNLINIFNLDDVDRLQGCQIINGTLLIMIRNKINETDLEHNLLDIKEIMGHLKIANSPYLTSLKFLRNLRKIHGQPLESNHFALVLYNNIRLVNLWEPKNFELTVGGMYIQRNGKLCNRYLREFGNKVVHDHKFDHIQTSDQEVLCEPAKLYLDVKVLSHRSVLLNWRKMQTSAEIELIYRPLTHNATQAEEDDALEGNVCTRINWKRQLLFSSELKVKDNGTHYSYVVDGLKQYTKYELLVKTFGDGDDQHDKRSKRQLFTTHIDMPTPPALEVIKKTDTTITLRLVPQNRTYEKVAYYYVEVYELPDNLAELNKRDYCLQQAVWYASELPHGYHEFYDIVSVGSGVYVYDYDDCCAQQEHERSERKFESQMHAEYSCSKDHAENCVYHETPANPVGAIEKLRVELNETNGYTLTDLARFRLYTLQVSACHEDGCGSYTMHSVRTNYSESGDKLVQLRACRVSDSLEYRVSFREPAHPNGHIFAYHVFFHNTQERVEAVHCLTPLEHAKAHFVFVTQLNDSYDEVGVSVLTLPGYSYITVNVTDCTADGTNVSNTQLAGNGHSQHGVNVFLLCFFLGAAGTLVWIVYKRRCWRHLPYVRRQLTTQCNCRAIVAQLMQSGRTAMTATTSVRPEDRQILVEEFQTVHFHNAPDDELTYLDSNNRHELINHRSDAAF